MGSIAVGATSAGAAVGAGTAKGLCPHPFFPPLCDDDDDGGSSVEVGEGSFEGDSFALGGTPILWFLLPGAAGLEVVVLSFFAFGWIR